MHKLATALMLSLAGFAAADPPPQVNTGFTVHMKSDSIDVYSMNAQISTVPANISAFGFSVFPEDRPIFLSNHPDHREIVYGKAHGGYQKVGRVKLPSKTISGYFTGSTPIIFSSSTLADFQKKRYFYLCTDLKELKAPFAGVIISTTNVSCAMIDPLSIESLEHYPGPIEGKSGITSIRFNPDLVRHLDSGPPSYWCQDRRGYNIYWVSYNANVGESILKPICDRESGEEAPNQVTEEERKEIIKNKDVYWVSLGFD